MKQTVKPLTKYVPPRIIMMQLGDELMQEDLNIPISGTTTPSDSDSKGYLWYDWDVDDEGNEREFDDDLNFK